MADFISRHSLFITSLALLICSFQLMRASIENRDLPQIGGRVVNSVMDPVEDLNHEIFESVRYLWKHYIWLLDVETERNDYFDRIKALEAQNSRYIEYENENRRLRSLLSFAQGSERGGIAASVVGRDPSNWIQTVKIDRGSDEGIRSGLPVVDGHAIVGQTTVVGGGSSKVLLLTDHASAIDAIVQRSRAPGIVEGTGKESLSFRYVLKDDEVEVGDRVIASGLDGVFPKGTLIGVVTSARVDVIGLFQEIELEPSVNLRKLENLLVLNSASERPQLSQEPEDKDDA